jgi:hypothetical protein
MTGSDYASFAMTAEPRWVQGKQGCWIEKPGLAQAVKSIVAYFDILRYYGTGFCIIQLTE